MEGLDIGKLIEKTEQLVYDGNIEGAAMGEMPVCQIVNEENGDTYLLSVKMTLQPKK